MRILFTFIGGLGHFQPLAPLAHAAAAAGHDVAVACSGPLVARVEAAGFETFGTSPPRSSSSVPARDLTPLTSVDRHATEVEFAESFATRGARRHAAALQEPIRTWRPDVVVRDEADFGSAIAAEVLGVPVVTVLVLAAGTLVRPELVTGPLDALRAEHGLPTDPGRGTLGTGLVLSPFPPSFRSPSSPIALPASTPSFRAGDPVTPTGPAPRRRVYVTLGTVFNRQSGDLFERLLAGLAHVDADVVMTVGRDVDPTELGPHPAHVRVERFVPQDTLLGATDLVVSHGGSGSLMAALARGLSSVLLPLGADQPHNAERARELGLARSLDAAAATPAEIAGAVTEGLDDEPMAERARAVADEIAALPGVEEAVALILERARSAGS